MRLTDLLTPEAVISSLKATSKKQALLELSEKAAELSGLAAREIFDALLQRERLGSTGIGDEVAIPHGKLMKLKNIFGIFARTRTSDRLRGARRRSGRSDLPADHPGKLRRGSFEGARLRRAGVARSVHGRDNPRDPRRWRVIFPARATLAAPRGLGAPRRGGRRAASLLSQERGFAQLFVTRFAAPTCEACPPLRPASEASA